MSRHRILSWLVALGALVGGAHVAEAAKNIVYLHGRSMSSYPPAAYLGADATWTHVGVSYDGSARLGDVNIRTTINNTLADKCGGTNQCVIVCYSAGCPRMLLSFRDLKAEARYPQAGILWTEALASSAGGSELADTSTKAGFRLLVKAFKSHAFGYGLVEGLESTNFESIDTDLVVGTMRNAYGYESIQNTATAPVYHLAGSRDVCLEIRILLFVKVKLCSNKYFPGRFGDGAVPVHSGAGYKDTAAYSNHNTGTAASKFTFRAYEQSALFDNDHFDIFAPGVFYGSLRLAVNKTAPCATAATPGLAALPEASIIYDDGDGPVTVEASPIALMSVCGNDVFNGEQASYATCLGNDACCKAFSNGDAGACTCGETLCVQTKLVDRSYFTGANCSGAEYADATNAAYKSWDGLGKGGLTPATMSFTSYRTPDGTCWQDFRATTAYVRRVYRPGVASLPADPSAKQLVNVGRLAGATATTMGPRNGNPSVWDPTSTPTLPRAFDNLFGPGLGNACARAVVKKAENITITLPSARTIKDVLVDTTNVSYANCDDAPGTVTAATRVLGGTLEYWNGAQWLSAGVLVPAAQVGAAAYRDMVLTLAKPITTSKLRLTNLQSTGSGMQIVEIHELVVAGY